jgi:glycosyltransferase involved in cell wall biosynthesis
MPGGERSVLHVLPHRGGGGETYVDVLDGMRGYRFTRVYVAPARSRSAPELAHGVAQVWRHVRAHDLLHVHGEAAAGLFLPLLAARPSLLTLHGLHLLRRSAGLGRVVAGGNVRLVTSAASRTICVSRAEHSLLVSAVGERATARARVVHNGVALPDPVAESERRAVRADLGLAASEPLGIWVGSLDERRDPASVARAAERAGVTVVFAGEGVLRPQVERVARDRVRLLGLRRDVPRLLAAADFFVLMSNREGFSFALLEAMAHGLATVVADVPENVEAIADSGLAVRYGDEAEIAGALRRLADNAEERAALGLRARERVGELFSAEGMVERTRALYDEVLGERSPWRPRGSRSV